MKVHTTVHLLIRMVNDVNDVLNGALASQQLPMALSLGPVDWPLHFLPPWMPFSSTLVFVALAGMGTVASVVPS